MKGLLISPHPGYLPTKPEPKTGERIALKVDGRPPYKDFKFSIRNPRHSIHNRFQLPREVATREMNGRKWSDGGIVMNVNIFAPTMEKGRALIDYVGGIMDTLDGSHGYYFTYLPIVYQDDSQVWCGCSRFIESSEIGYRVEIEFVDHVEENGVTCLYENSTTI